MLLKTKNLIKAIVSFENFQIERLIMYSLNKRLLIFPELNETCRSGLLFAIHLFIKLNNKISGMRDENVPFNFRVKLRQWL